MGKQKVRHTIEIIFPLLLIFTFGICVISVVISGSDIYRKTAAGLRENYTVRTAVPYLQEKIRECEDDSNIEILSYNGGDVLAIYSEDKEKISSATYIYLDEGYLKELFTRKSDMPSYGAGQKLVHLDSFQVIKEEGFIRLQVENEGEAENFIVSIAMAGEKQ